MHDQPAVVALEVLYRGCCSPFFGGADQLLFELCVNKWGKVAAFCRVVDALPPGLTLDNLDRHAEERHGPVILAGSRHLKRRKADGYGHTNCCELAHRPSPLSLHRVAPALEARPQGAIIPGLLLAERCLLLRGRLGLRLCRVRRPAPPLPEAPVGGAAPPAVPFAALSDQTRSAGPPKYDTRSGRDFAGP